MTDQKDNTVQTSQGERRPWQGILADEFTAVRHAVVAILCLLSIFIAVGPLGFYPSFDTHILILVVPVALSSLLLGKWYGCAIGALAGLAEMMHAIYQPYNYYEKYFSIPINSLVLLAVFGFVMGVLFGFAHRFVGSQGHAEEDALQKGGARIPVLLAVSVAGALLFVGLLQGGIYLANTTFGLVLPGDLATRALDARGIVEQVILHVLLISIPCITTDIAVGRLSLVRRKPQVRTTFQTWFGVVTIVFFFVASGVAYTAVTYMSLINMNAALDDQLESLSADLKQRDAIVNTLDSREVFPREELSQFARLQYSRIDVDLSGWYQELTMLASDDEIFVSTNSDLVGTSLSELVNEGLGSATFQDVVSANEALEYYQGNGFELAYVRAIEIDYERLGNTGSYQLATIVPARETFLNRGLYMYLVAAVFAFMLGALFIAIMRLLRRVVVLPVDATNEVLERITAGELDQRVPDSNSAEFSSLSEGINTTVGALENSIAEANVRIDSELAAARTIQESALPSARPPFPHIDAFDIYAMMNPAREVGGDFYDFFELSGERIGFVVADVSGKGMPAALFMMAAKTAIRGAMEAKADLAQSINIANRSLCEGNESEMFVTAFAGVLEYKTGKLTFVNAGHNKPLMQHDGTWTWMKERSGPYLGSFDWVEYNKFEIQLQPGDELFVYTDGVTEAFNANSELYGNDRLEAYLDYVGKLHPRQMLRAIRAELRGWSEGTEQSDDITMLALKFGIPPESGASLDTTASIENFEQIEAFIRQQLAECECPHKVANQLLVAVEELVANVCNYAYPDASPENPGPLRVHFTHQSSPNAIMIEVGDNGIAFNPLAHEDPEQPASIEEAKVGGLGLMMTKKFMDKVEYVREGITNVTIVTKYW